MDRAGALILLGIAACGDGGSSPDAAADANLVDFAYTGTLLDWDSAGITPCPVVGATLTATYDDQRTTTTDAAGRFTLGLASYTPLVDIVPPAEASSCAGDGYALPLIAIAPPAVSLAGSLIEARAMTRKRVTSFFAALGTPFDPARGHVLVHVNGTPRAFSIAEPHAAAQAFDGTAWSAGDTGRDVFFPNVEIPAPARATVTVAGGNAIGLGAVQLAPGAITVMTVILR